MRAADDARHRVPDARAAAVRGHRRERIAQSVRRQRHQVLLGGGRQTARRGRSGDRNNDGEAAGVRPLGGARQGAAHRRRRGALHRILQEHVSIGARPARPASRGRLRARRGLSHRAAGVPRARRRCRDHRRGAERHEHQRRLRRHESEGARREGARNAGGLRHRARRRRRSAGDVRQRQERSTTAISCST